MRAFQHIVIESMARVNLFTEENGSLTIQVSTPVFPDSNITIKVNQLEKLELGSTIVSRETLLTELVTGVKAKRNISGQ